MIYRPLGNTGMDISSLGFGCMRLPMIEKNEKKIIDQEQVNEMFKKAIDLGVNYFDTAWFYNNELSEAAVGIALKEVRNDVYISSKSPGHLIKKPGDYRRTLETQLKRLDTDFIDLYHFHGIGYDNFLEIDKNSGWLEEAEKAKSEGLIKHIAFSFHDKPENMIKLIDMGHFESVLCQYNVIDQSNGSAMKYASEKGLGVIVMGPLGGGRVSGLPAELTKSLNINVKSNSELALRFVFSNPHIDCALSGMENMSMLLENAAVSEQRSELSSEEAASITSVMNENSKLSDLYCTGCNYCMPCPEEVNIPHIFRMMNYYKVYNIKDFAQKGYAEIGNNEWVKGNRADSCTECGICETKCPQKIEIREQLKESHLALAASV
ncbi:MAG: aldo/keto reductase [Spirochaetaceae bacterium]|nr:aldo/keto reductase [Spirochaetaceae bacterium]